jgi:putative SOS response-associated peptidase YedK
MASERRQPIWFHRPDNGIFYFAGLYESWQPTPDTWQRTFTIITTTPNDLIAPIHDRMPVVVTSDQLDDWLFQGNEPDAVRSLLVPAPDDLLIATPVSPRVNSVRNDDAGCLEQVPYALAAIR